MVALGASTATSAGSDLKGGSGNFGFVTRIDQEVFQSNQVYANLNSYTLDKKPAVREAFFDFVNNQDNEPESQMIVSTSWRQHCGVDGMSSNRLLNVTVFIYLYSRPTPNSHRRNISDMSSIATSDCPTPAPAACRLT